MSYIFFLPFCYSYANSNFFTCPRKKLNSRNRNPARALWRDGAVAGEGPARALTEIQFVSCCDYMCMRIHNQSRTVTKRDETPYYVIFPVFLQVVESLRMGVSISSSCYHLTFLFDKGSFIKSRLLH